MTTAINPGPMTDDHCHEEQAPAYSSSEATSEETNKDIKAESQDPLTRAILNQSHSELQLILSSDDNRNWNETLPESIYTPLLLAVQTKAPISIVQTLLEHSPTNPLFKVHVDKTSPRAGGFTPLMVACHLQQHDVAAVLLKHGAQVNAFAQGNRRTALMLAAGQNHVPLTQLLLDHGANCLQYDEQAKSAFIYACSNNALETVQLMARHYREPNNYSMSYLVNHSKVDPPLWYASAMGHVRIVIFLLEHGATVEYRRQDATIYSTTPLMESCEWGHLEVVQVLLQHGADPCSKTGRKALKLARESGYHSVVSCMEFWQQRLDHLQRLIDQPRQLGRFDLSVWPKLLAIPGKRPGLVHQLLQQYVERPDATALFSMNSGFPTQSLKKREAASSSRQKPIMKLPVVLLLVAVMACGSTTAKVASASSWQGRQSKMYHGFDHRRKIYSGSEKRSIVDEESWGEGNMEKWEDATSSGTSSIDKEGDESQDESWEFLNLQTEDFSQTVDSVDNNPMGFSNNGASSDQEHEERILSALHSEETQHTDTWEAEKVNIPHSYAYKSRSSVASERKSSQKEVKRTKGGLPYDRRKQSQCPQSKQVAGPTKTVFGSNREVSKENRQRIKENSDGKSQLVKAASKADLSSVANPWVQMFLAQNPGEKLMLVPLDFLLDNFNLAQLAPVVECIVHRTLFHQDVPSDSTSYPFYKRGLQLLTLSDPFAILQPSKTVPSEASAASSPDLSDVLEKEAVELAAVVLYCLVHQRYVLSPRGHEALWRRFLLHSPPNRSPQQLQALFGRCPRASCRGMPLLPAGNDDYVVNDETLEAQSVPLSFRYCGHCQTYWAHWKEKHELFSPTGRHIQGCAWGRSLGPLFHMSYPQFLKPQAAVSEEKPKAPSEPRIFGFRIHPSA